MTKHKLGVSKNATISVVTYDEDWDIIRRDKKRARTTRDDRNEQAEARRHELEKLRDDLKGKQADNDTLMDAPGGLEVDDTVADDDVFLEWVEGELCGLNDNKTGRFIFTEEDDGDSDFEDEEEEEKKEEECKNAYTAYLRQRRKEHSRPAEQNRTQTANEHWESLYPCLLDAFLEWEAYGAPTEDKDAEWHAPIVCLNMFDQESLSFPCDPSKPLTETMVHHGYMPTSALHPSVGISLQVLEAYRAINSRCPNLGIQPFVHGLCELQKVAFRVAYARSFSRAFDVYLELVHRVDTSLDDLLFPTLLSRYQDMCPSCTTELPGEDQLRFKMLIAMDGNESLKRNLIQRRVVDNKGNTVGVQNIERPDERTRKSHLFVESSTVDMYKNEVKKRSPRPSTLHAENVEHVVLAASSSTTTATGNTSTNAQQQIPSPSQNSLPAASTFGNASIPIVVSEHGFGEGSPVDGTENNTPCTDRWSNLAEDSKKKMWGTFDETGIFIAACRHGIVLLICDMIRSGELAKYPLALTSQLIDTFGDKLLAGYDIGCGFSTTANNSKLVGPKIKSNDCRFCCGAFHGHAHCRVCQLQWHPLYIKGAGLEDFEGCERVFSESNRVAGITRHTSKFHRRQAIIHHFTRWNSDKYAELLRFLINNYKQALWNIEDLTRELAKAKEQLKIESDDLFAQWNTEELEYLKAMQSQQPSNKDAHEMEYLAVLKKLAAAKELYEVKTTQWIRLRPEHFSQGVTDYTTDATETQRIETANVRGLDSLLTLQSAARALESKLNIKTRWVAGSEDWLRVDKSLAERSFDRAIDRLEGLVMSRLFELAKMNQAGTGYKMRMQICKALKARSKAVRTAVKLYNEAAARLSRPTLKLGTVLKYVFIGQFDILRLSRHNINERPWTREAERDAIVKYYKLLRSQEELRRLDIEIRRLHTYIITSEVRVQTVIADLEESNPRLAVQLKRRYAYRHAMNRVHLCRLQDVESWEEFTGDRDPLRSVPTLTSTTEERDTGDSESVQAEVDDEDIEDDEEETNDEFAALSSAFDVLSVYEQ